MRQFAAYTGSAFVRLEDGTALGEAFVMLQTQYVASEGPDERVEDAGIVGYIEFDAPMNADGKQRVDPPRGEPMIIGSTLGPRMRLMGPPSEVKVVQVLAGRRDGRDRYLVAEVD